MASIQYDSVELLNATYIPQFVKHETVAERQITSVPRTREDGEVLVVERYGKKIIALQGTLVGSSQADLDSKIDTFTELFSRKEKNLDISWNGGTRRYVASCSKHTFDRDHHNTSAVPWSAEFTVLSGEGKDTSTTTAANADIVTITTPGTDSFTLAGSKPPKPKITIDGSTYSPDSVIWPSTVKGIEYKNTDTGEKMVVNVDATWQGSTKKVIINCDTKKVTQTLTTGAEVEVPFYGVFPQFAVGTNNIQITAGQLISQTSSETSIPTTILSTNAAAKKLAQSFLVPYTDATYESIRVAITKVGTPGTVTIRIETDNGNAPSGTLVDANATLTISSGTIGTDTFPQYYSANFPGTFKLTANTPYWIVLSAASTTGANYYSWAVDANLYPSGQASAAIDGTTWVAQANGTVPESFVFRLYYGGLGGTGKVYHTVQYAKTYL